MSGAPYVPALSELIPNPAIVTEFERVAAALAALQQIVLAQARGTNPPGSGGVSSEAGIRWLTGPWLLNPDGNVKGGAVCRPPPITANQIFYAPDGIDDAIWLEIEGTANFRIDRLKVKARQHRFLVMINRGNFDFTLTYAADTTLDPGASYPFGFANGLDYVLRSAQALVLYQDPGSGNWRAQSYSEPPTLSGGVVPNFSRRNFWAFRCNAGTAQAPFGIGSGNPSVQGTATSNHDSTNTYQQFRAAAGLFAGLAGVSAATGAIVQPQQDPTWIFQIKTGSDLANLRIWILATDTAATSVDTLAAAVDAVGFRYSTVAGDGGWVGVTKVGAGSQSVTATVAAIAVSTAYALKIRKSGSTVYFSVNGSAEQSLTTNLPGATVELGYNLYVFDTSGSATKDLNISCGSCEYGSFPAG